jgi:phosphoribosylanthranilate isomerase
MTWVKICGITNLEDALAAAEAGADALGFVFYEKSPRYVDPGTAAAIAQQVRDKIEKVGVFVDPPQNGLADIANGVGLTMLQCRVGWKPGAESKAAFQQPVRMLFQLSVGRLLADEKRFQGLIAEFLRMSESPKRPSGLDTFLLDSSTPEQPGGTGRTLDWKRLAPLVHVMNKSAKVVAAGGLTPANVTEAMRLLRPWGVDVSSGVEVSPGKKDPMKVRAFLKAVREADRASLKN